MAVVDPVEGAVQTEVEGPMASEEVVQTPAVEVPMAEAVGNCSEPAATTTTEEAVQMQPTVHPTHQ
jgi:hypothetical protein